MEYPVVSTQRGSGEAVDVFDQTNQTQHTNEMVVLGDLLPNKNTLEKRDEAWV